MTTLRFLLSRHSWYWAGRNLVRKLLHFIFLRPAYSTRLRIRSLARRTKHLFEIVYISIKDIAFTVLVCLLIYYSLHKSGFDVLELKKDSKVYETILGTVAAIGGVIIGLYYAAISSLSTSIYSRFPQEIKELLAREPVTTVFMRYLAFLTFFSISLLCLDFLGAAQRREVVILILLLSGIGIFAITKLGQRIFLLSDPVILAHTIYQSILDSISEARAGGFQWHNGTFQTHYGSRARDSVRSLSLLQRIQSQGDNLNEHSLMRIVILATEILDKYEPSKRKIPSTSDWFPLSYKHPEWYRAPDLTVQSASEMGYLEPEREKDFFWYERNLINCAVSSIDPNLISIHTMSTATTSIGLLSDSLSTIASSGEVKFATDTWMEIQERLLTTFSTHCTPEVGDEGVFVSVGFSEQLGAVGPSIIVGLLKYLDSYSSSELERKFEEIDWTSRHFFFNGDLPFYLGERLVWIHERINFELGAEGRQVSPSWYLKTMFFQSVAFKLDEISKAVLGLVERSVERLGYFSPTGKSTWALAPLVDRIEELVKKSGHALSLIESELERISQYNSLDGLQWPEADLDSLSVRLDKIQENLALKRANILTSFRGLKRKDSLPDYPGKFLHYTGEHLVEFLLRDPPSLNTALFMQYFTNSFDKIEEMRGVNATSDWQKEQLAQMSTSPVIDLVNFSGLCLLLSKVFEKKDVWETVENQWLEYFDGEYRAARMNYVATVLAFAGSSISLPYRSVIRNEWNGKAYDFIESKIPSKQKMIRRGMSQVFSQYMAYDTRDPIVRAYLRSDEFNMFSGEEIFINAFFSRLQGAEGLKTSRKSDDFSRAVELEKERGYEFKDEGSDND